LIDGVEEDGLNLSRLHIPGLSRYYINKLLQAGYNHKQCLKELSTEDLSKILPDMLAIRIKKNLPPALPSFSTKNYKPKTKNLPPEICISSPPPCTSQPVFTNLHLAPCTLQPVLEISLLRPDRIIFMGKNIEVTAKEFSLIHLLAQHNRQVMSYEDIVKKIWGPKTEAIYTRVIQHIYQFRKNILNAIGNNKTNKEKVRDIFKAVPRRGVMLNVNDEELKIN